MLDQLDQGHLRIVAYQQEAIPSSAPNLSSKTTLKERGMFVVVVFVFKLISLVQPTLPLFKEELFSRAGEL